MERLTMRDVGGRAFWVSPQNPGGGYRMTEDKEDQERLDRLAAYEDAMSIERAQELAQAEKDGRLAVLPCKNDTVYTIEEDYFNCAKCRHGSSAYYQAKIDRVSCDMNNDVHRPFYIKEHEVGGFEISFDATGFTVLSSPGEFGYEGLEQFCGIDGKVYYTCKEAEAALKKREEAGL